MYKRNLYEERITIWKTSSFEKAIELAEREAEQYEKDADCKYIGLSQAFQMFDEVFENGTEVFSLMRENNYSPKMYIKTYFDKGSERQGNVG